MTLTPTFQLKTTEADRQLMRMAAQNGVDYARHHRLPGYEHESQVLKLLDDLEAALARVAALEAAFNAYVKASMENRDLRR